MSERVRPMRGERLGGPTVLQALQALLALGTRREV